MDNNHFFMDDIDSVDLYRTKTKNNLKTALVKLLENHKNDVMLQFRKEFQKNNVEQIKKYNELMNK